MKFMISITLFSNLNQKLVSIVEVAYISLVHERIKCIVSGDTLILICTHGVNLFYIGYHLLIAIIYNY